MAFTHATRVRVPAWERDDMAEWLRRWPAKPLCIARVSSNLTVVVRSYGVVVALRTLNPATRVQTPVRPFLRKANKKMIFRIFSVFSSIAQLVREHGC